MGEGVHEFAATFVRAGAWAGAGVPATPLVVLEPPVNGSGRLGVGTMSGGNGNGSVDPWRGIR